jgi:hypothetical protein
MNVQAEVLDANDLRKVAGIARLENGQENDKIWWIESMIEKCAK